MSQCNTTNDIGKRICALREAKGKTQKELGDALGVKRETVNQWENGTRDLKTQYTISLANYFDVTCDEILRGIKSENVGVSKITGLSDEAIDTLRLFSEWDEDDDIGRFESDEFCRTMSKLIVGISRKTNILNEINHLAYIKCQIAYLEQLSDEDFEAERPSNINMLYSAYGANKYKADEIISLHNSHDYSHWKIQNEFREMLDNTLAFIADEDLSDKLESEWYIEMIKRKRAELLVKRDPRKNRNISDMLSDLDKEYARLKESILSAGAGE